MLKGKIWSTQRERAVRNPCLLLFVGPFAVAHLFVKYAANSTSQHRILASGGTLLLQRSLQCCGLAGHESHCTLDDPIGLAFSTGGLSGTAWLPSSQACQCLNRRLVVAPDRDSVVPQLVDELRCSLCNPAKFRSFSWNQHRPRHLVSPFTDDQESLVLEIPTPRNRNPWTHGAPFQFVLSIRSPVRRVQITSHHTELAP